MPPGKRRAGTPAKTPRREEPFALRSGSVIFIPGVARVRRVRSGTLAWRPWILLLAMPIAAVYDTGPQVIAGFRTKEGITPIGSVLAALAPDRVPSRAWSWRDAYISRALSSLKSPDRPLAAVSGCAEFPAATSVLLTSTYAQSGSCSIHVRAEMYHERAMFQTGVAGVGGVSRTGGRSAGAAAGIESRRDGAAPRADECIGTGEDCVPRRGISKPEPRRARSACA